MMMKAALRVGGAGESGGLPNLSAKTSPVLALVELDQSTRVTVGRAFAQCGIGAMHIGEDFAARISKEKFEGCVLHLNEGAMPILEAIRSSASNRRMILYGIAPRGVPMRQFSRYGINAIFDVPLDRAAVLRTARSTCALLLQELRRYVRIPLVMDVSIQSSDWVLTGSSREISGGGISLQMVGDLRNSHRLRLSFALPGKPSLTIAAAVCWKNDSLFGFQFDDADPSRQLVKSWIDSFLGLP